jgi:mannose-6-phosphate isomerase-like protein (cupin superfamily)
MNATTQSNVIVDLLTQSLHFERRGTVRADQHRIAHGADDDDWRLAIFNVETDEDVHADYWERHALADEAVCCLHGAIRLHLRATEPDTLDDVIQLHPGQAAIVPRDRWHRLEVDEPTDLLAVTTRRGTKHEKRTTS